MRSALQLCGWLPERQVTLIVLNGSVPSFFTYVVYKYEIYEYSGNVQRRDERTVYTGTLACCNASNMFFLRKHVHP